MTIRARSAGRLLTRFLREEGGNFAIMTAILFPVLLGFSALAVEYGMGLLTRAGNQRVADIAAFAGALQYSSGGTETQMRQGAIQAAKLNGVRADEVEVSLVPSPRGTGKAVHVRIESQQLLVLAPILGGKSILSIGVDSYAVIGHPGTPACILALDGSLSGVVLTGGTSVTASKCTVASNASVSVPCGTKISAQGVTYDTGPPSQPCSGIVSPDGSAANISRAYTPDPLAGDPRILTATSRLAEVAGLATPGIPAVAAGPDIEFSWSNQGGVASQVSAAGCTASGSAPTWVVTCPASGFKFGSVAVKDDITVNFDTASISTKTYTFSGGIDVSASGRLTFPDGNYVVAKGIKAQAATKTAFGKGSFKVGQVTVGCNSGGAGRHSVCVDSGASLTFGGPSQFVFEGGFSNGGGSTLKLGAGTTNTFQMGPSSDGNSISLGGGSQTVMADALGGDGSFSIKGHVNGGGGGSCFIVSAAPQHDIGGSVLVSGAIILGAGVYTVDGAFLLGSAGGGGAVCGGSTVSVRAIGVTIVVSGKTVVSSGSCANTAFCIAAGYSNVVLSAPTSGATSGLAVIGPTDGKILGASLVEGASGASISGAFYFPTGPIVMGGGASLGGSCLQLIGSRIELSGGASTVSDCLAGTAGSKKSKVMLVQ